MTTLRNSIVGSGNFDNEKTLHSSIIINDTEPVIDNTPDHKRSAVASDSGRLIRERIESEARSEEEKALLDFDHLYSRLKNAQATIYKLEAQIRRWQKERAASSPTAKDKKIGELRAHICLLVDEGDIQAKKEKDKYRGKGANQTWAPVNDERTRAEKGEVKSEAKALAQNIGNWDVSGVIGF